jgi:hypothetical protein
MSASITPTPNLNEREAAQFLHCSVALLRRWRCERRGPRWTKVGRLVRYPRSWLEEFVEANAHGSGKE